MKGLDEFVKERCEFCNTAIVMQGSQGTLIRFTAHDDNFCKVTMRGTIDMQQKIIESAEIDSAMSQHRFYQALKTAHRLQDELLTITVAQAIKERNERG